jgi:GTP-binding protein
VWLRLKLIADAGIVGLPNAGKSTFLAATSHAKPKIADYPFTTLTPNLGVVQVDDREFVLADIPGLIEDAHQGAGLGTRFLGHVERTGVLLHLIDATDENPVKAYRTVRHEIEAYGHGLAEKPEIIALSKTDAISATDLTKAKRKLTRATGTVPLVLSSATGTGVREALAALLHVIDAGRVEQAIAQTPVEERTAWHPTDG